MINETELVRWESTFHWLFTVQVRFIKARWWTNSNDGGIFDGIWEWHIPGVVVRKNRTCNY